MRLSRRSLECLGVAWNGASVLHIMPARATLALTAAGTVHGFTLSEFAALNSASGGYGHVWGWRGRQRKRYRV